MRLDGYQLRFKQLLQNDKIFTKTSALLKFNFVPNLYIIPKIISRTEEFSKYENYPFILGSGNG